MNDLEMLPMTFILGSRALLKKLAIIIINHYLPVRVFGNFMYPADGVTNLGVWFVANLSFAHHVCNIFKT